MNMTYVGDCDKQREVSGELQKGRNETKQCRSCHRTGTHKLFLWKGVCYKCREELI